MDTEQSEEVKTLEEFVEGCLKPNLLRAIAERDKVFEQQKIFSDLRKNTENLEKNTVTSMKTLVNVGAEIYTEAEVQIEEYTSKIGAIKVQIKVALEAIRKLLKIPDTDL